MMFCGEIAQWPLNKDTMPIPSLSILAAHTTMICLYYRNRIVTETLLNSADACVFPADVQNPKHGCGRPRCAGGVHPFDNAIYLFIHTIQSLPITDELKGKNYLFSIFVMQKLDFFFKVVDYMYDHRGPYALWMRAYDSIFLNALQECYAKTLYIPLDRQRLLINQTEFTFHHITVYDWGRKKKYIMYILPFTKFCHVRQYYSKCDKKKKPGISALKVMLYQGTNLRFNVSVKTIEEKLPMLVNKGPVFVYDDNHIIEDYETPASLGMDPEDCIIAICNTVEGPPSSTPSPLPMLPVPSVDKYLEFLQTFQHL
jgi:hypothetical protein